MYVRETKAGSEMRRNGLLFVRSCCSARRHCKDWDGRRAGALYMTIHDILFSPPLPRQSYLAQLGVWRSGNK